MNSARGALSASYFVVVWCANPDWRRSGNPEFKQKDITF